MFQVLSGERKRRVISPTTLAASVAAHVLLLGGALYAASGDGGGPEEPPADTTFIWQADDPPPPDPVDPAPPPPQQPDQPAAPPTPGEVLQLPTPTEVPDDIVPEAPDVKPVNPDDYRGDGRIGDIKGPPPVEPTLPTGNPNPPAGGGEYIPDEYSVEERPVLDRSGLGRALERHYPPVLRDSRVSGRVVIEMIVNEDGRVREGSARVLEASHPAFGEAALRTVDRFRFRPAKMAGVPVPVRVTIPIQWTVPN